MASNLSKDCAYKDETSTSEDGLLETHQDIDISELEKLPDFQQKSWFRWRSPHVFVLSHVLMLLFYTAFFILSMHWLQRGENGPNLIYCQFAKDHFRQMIMADSPSAPARHTVHYEKKLLHNSVYDQNPFKGDPSPELDAVWHDLFRCQ